RARSSCVYVQMWECRSIVNTLFFIFFFQAEDGIRGKLVTGVRRVLFRSSKVLFAVAKSFDILTFWFMLLLGIGYSEATGRKVKEIGRASGREGGENLLGPLESEEKVNEVIEEATLSE